MKRAIQEVLLCPTLPVEIWCHIVDTKLQLPSDIKTVGAIFMLCKEVYQSLRCDSPLILDLIMVTRLNRRYAMGDWFICSRCNKLCIHKKPRFDGRTPGSTSLRGVMMSGSFCGSCMILCARCNRHYLHGLGCLCDASNDNGNDDYDDVLDDYDDCFEESV